MTDLGDPTPRHPSPDDPITPESLLAAARAHGRLALGADPDPGIRCQVLLASLGVDVAQPAVQRRLLVLARDKRISLTWVSEEDLAQIPADLRDLWERSRFCHQGTWYDSIEWYGQYLVERSDEDLLDLVTRGAGRAQPTPREWARLAVLAVDQAGAGADCQARLREELGLSCCDGGTRHRVWCPGYPR